MSSRKRRSSAVRLRIFLAHDGICHVCKGKISVGEAWDLDHVVPLALYGEDEESNLAPAHRKTCHAGKTATADVPAIAKAKRRQARHLGAATGPTRKITSPGFAPAPRQCRATGRIAKALPPRRGIYRPSLERPQ